jgi:hypothetical protein
MNIKQFVDQNSLEHVKSFLLTLRDLEETNGKQVRDIEYFIRLREEREAEEAQLKAEMDLAVDFADGVARKFPTEYKRENNEVVVCTFFGDFVVKVLRKA